MGRAGLGFGVQQLVGNTGAVIGDLQKQGVRRGMTRRKSWGSKPLPRSAVLFPWVTSSTHSLPPWGSAFVHIQPKHVRGPAAALPPLGPPLSPSPLLLPHAAQHTCSPNTCEGEHAASASSPEWIASTMARVCRRLMRLAPGWP